MNEIYKCNNETAYMQPNHNHNRDWLTVILLLVGVLVTVAATGQEYRQMNQKYSYENNVQFQDSIFGFGIPGAGSILRLDTTTGYVWRSEFVASEPSGVVNVGNGEASFINYDTLNGNYRFRTFGAGDNFLVDTNASGAIEYALDDSIDVDEVVTNVLSTGTANISSVSQDSSANQIAVISANGDLNYTTASNIQIPKRRVFAFTNDVSVTIPNGDEVVILVAKDGGLGKPVDFLEDFYYTIDATIEYEIVVDNVDNDSSHIVFIETQPIRWNIDDGNNQIENTSVAGVQGTDYGYISGTRYETHTNVIQGVTSSIAPPSGVWKSNVSINTPKFQFSEALNGTLFAITASVVGLPGNANDVQVTQINVIITEFDDIDEDMENNY